MMTYLILSYQKIIHHSPIGDPIDISEKHHHKLQPVVVTSSGQQQFAKHIFSMQGQNVRICSYRSCAIDIPCQTYFWQIEGQPSKFLLTHAEQLNVSIDIVIDCSMQGDQAYRYVPENAQEKSQRVFNQFTNKYEDECDFEGETINAKKEVELRMYKGGPKHRVVFSGLSLEGTCSNKECRVYQKRVWVKKGYGKFHVGEARFKCHCPQCGKKLPSNSVTNLGYRNTFVRIQGMRKIAEDEEEPFLMEDREESGKLIKLENFDESICTWGYISFECTPLEKIKIQNK